MKKTLKKLVIDSWKTTVAGIIVAVIAGLVATGKLTSQQGTTVMGIAASVGFAFSKDGDKSEFKAVQKSEVELAEEALDAAKDTGNEQLITMMQAALNALKHPVN
jgi:hypothetical protein